MKSAGFLSSEGFTAYVKQQRGVTLVEVMVALGISAVVISGTMLFMANSNKSRELLDIMSTRDAIASRLSQTAGLPAAIAVAMGTNAALRDCVMGNGTTTACTASITSAATQQAFDLSIPLGTAGVSRDAGR